MYTVATNAVLPVNIKGIAERKENTARLKREKRTTVRPKTVDDTELAKKIKKTWMMHLPQFYRNGI